jgi:hypothetical protein
MWHMIPSLATAVQALTPAFTDPSFATQCQLLLGWLICPGTHTIYRVGQTMHADEELAGADRHPFDRVYNFFSRSAWTVSGLAYRVAAFAITALRPDGPLVLIVDDTLLHKRGRHVWGLGWFRDAVASTRKRVATASGNNWVVLGLAVPIPGCPGRVLCLPLSARLRRPGKTNPSCAALTAQMLKEVRTWFPQRPLILVGDGAYACKTVVAALDPAVTFVGRMRGDAALFDARPPKAVRGRRGPKPKKGPRLLSPKAAATTADRKRNGQGPWVWQAVNVAVYGQARTLQTLAYRALWPSVAGLRPVQVVVVRDPEGRMQDAYLVTTDLQASSAWVIETFAQRWSIEVLFRASKQVMAIEAPQHWCQQSIEKLAPWVWLMQTVATVWYMTEGHQLPEAATARESMSVWESEWSLRHMLKVLRGATLDATINKLSAAEPDPQSIIQILKNCVNIAA